jgi:hypothetical protein
MSAASKRSWKMERASVHTKGKSRPRSNRYSATDSHEKPAPGTPTRSWVGSYDRADGTHVQGHYRSRHA